jgi:endonuclease YncB( thermonuclease family)
MLRAVDRLVTRSMRLLKVLLLICTFDTSADGLAGRVVHVFDGDTFLLQTHAGERIIVRIAEIDAPEGDQPFGNASTDMLEHMVDGKRVEVVIKDIDDYGRTVGRPFTGIADVAAEMVRDGGAWAYRRYVTDPELVCLETAARLGQVGLWSAAAEPVAPWDWRHGEPEPDCAIKGNISSDGERIYHVPGQRYYGVTRINASTGERWFCTEAEAHTAGWRRSRV